MRAIRTSVAGVALLAVLAVTGCAGAGRGAERVPGPDGAAAAAADLKVLFRARQDSARLRYVEADVRFVQGMIAHHAQAIVMAELAPTHGASGAVRTLAARIINAQRDEIAAMEAWLRERGEAVPEVHVLGLEVMAHGAAHAAHDMPGMLTVEQMRELDRARGPEFDRLFLTYMIQHHRGAVVMVHDLFATDGAGQDEAVFKLASDVQVDQATEIARMEQMLSALPAAGGAR